MSYRNKTHWLTKFETTEQKTNEKTIITPADLYTRFCFCPK